MNVEDKTILVTGANRGIGRALVDEVLKEARSGCMRLRANHLCIPTNALTA
jgi:NAD(P)-dependent dehydrogenase (short-subunit alcohol dehydrogenase family)